MKAFRNLETQFLRDLPVTARRIVMESIETGRYDRIPRQLQQISERYDIPVDTMMRWLELVTILPRLHKENPLPLF